MTPFITSPHFDRLIYACFLGYALLSCLNLDRLPATLLSVALILGCLRLCFSSSSVLSARHPKVNRVLVALAIYWVAILLSAFYNYDAVRGVQAWSYIDRTLTLPGVILFCRTRKQLLGLVFAVAISLTIANSIAIAQTLLDWTVHKKIHRAISLYDYPVVYSEFIQHGFSFLLAFIFCSAHRLPNTWYRLTPIIWVCSISALILTQTRAAWIGVAAAGLWIMFEKSRARALQPKRFLLLLLVPLLIISVFIASPTLADRAKSVTDLSYGSNAGRLFIWQGALQMFFDHPILGVGPDRFGEEYVRNYIIPQAEQQQRDAHHTYLSVAAELGMIGLGAFLYLLYCLYRALLYSFSAAKEIEWPLSGLLCLMAFCIYGFMNSMTNTFWGMRLFFMLLGISLQTFLLENAQIGNGRQKNNLKNL